MCLLDIRRDVIGARQSTTAAAEEAVYECPHARGGPAAAAAAAAVETVHSAPRSRGRRMPSPPPRAALLLWFICPCSPSWAGPGQEGNPKLGRLMHLVSQTDLSITICPDGTVKGSPGLDEYGLLEISSVGFNNEVRLRGVKSGLYLGMDEQGILYGEADPTNEATVFASGVHGAYNTYQAKAHVGEDTWFVGLRRRTGMPKPGPLTRPEQKAARFLPVRPAASGEGGGGGGAPL